MKAKLITLTFVLFCTNYVFGQNKVYDLSDCLRLEIGSYKSLSDVKRTYAITSKDTCKIYFIEIQPWNSSVHMGGLSHDEAHCYLNNTDTLYTTLKNIENKFKEWTEVAKNNLTPSFEKEIPIDIPVAGVSIWNFGKSNFELMPVNKKRFVFFKTQSNAPDICVHMESKFTYYHTTFHKQFNGRSDVALAFSTPEQFSAFVELFNPDKFRDRLGKTTIDNLFK